MAYHEKLQILATYRIFLRKKKNTIYQVLFVHYELRIYGENKNEISVKIYQLTYIRIKKFSLKKEINFR